MIMRAGIATVALFGVALVAVIVVPVVLLIGLLCSARRTSAADRVVLFPGLRRSAAAGGQFHQQTNSSVRGSRLMPVAGL
jgi:hypothetical protein